MTDQEAAGLRTYLQKGGFVIVDDFRYQHWGNFEQQMMRVHAGGAHSSTWTSTQPIFHAFFEIKTLDVPQYYDPPPAIFRAIYEDNDPNKRIMVIDQLQHRHLRVLGMVGHRAANRSTNRTKRISWASTTSSTA